MVRWDGDVVVGVKLVDVVIYEKVAVYILYSVIVVVVSSESTLSVAFLHYEFECFGGVAIESNFGGDFAYVLVVFGVVWSFA